MVYKYEQVKTTTLSTMCRLTTTTTSFTVSCVAVTIWGRRAPEHVQKHVALSFTGLVVHLRIKTFFAQSQHCRVKTPSLGSLLEREREGEIKRGERERERKRFLCKK